MATFRGFVLASTLAACSGSTHHIRRVAHLQPNATSALPTDEIKEKVISAFEGAFSAPKVAEKDATKRPVAVQVEEKAISQTRAQLSPACQQRFDAMMDGSGPRMASFQAHGSSEDSPDAGKQCDKLKGKLCKTEAQISEEATHTDGRKLMQVISVEGNSCVPAECTARGDLGALGKFMHGQTKEIMPGEDLHVNLHVNCAASGGGDVTINHKGNVACTAPTVFGSGSTQQACSGARELPLAVAVLAALVGAILAC